MVMHDVSWKAGLPPVDESRVGATLAEALSMWGTPVPGGRPGQRFDAAGGMVGGPDVLDRWRRRCDAELINQIRQRGMRLGPWVHHAMHQHLRSVQAQRRRDGLKPLSRRDAIGLQGGIGGFPRDFDFIRKKVWVEARQPLNAMRLFPMDTGVPLGARSHTARRELGTGRADIHRGGTDIPRADVGWVEEQFGVDYVVCSVGQGFFETLTTDFAGLRRYEGALRVGRRLVEEKMNEIAWNGDAPTKVFGVLNYPSLAKQNMSVAFTDNPDPKDVLRALQDLANTPKIQSGARGKPNRLAVSVRIWAFLHTRKHETLGGTDTTIAEFFIRTNGLGITQIDEAQELDGIGPNGEDGILFYRDELDTMGHVVIQAPTTLPLYQSGPLDQLTVIYGATGGMVMGDVFNCILGLAVAV